MFLYRHLMHQGIFVTSRSVQEEFKKIGRWPTKSITLIFPILQNYLSYGYYNSTAGNCFAGNAD